MLEIVLWPAHVQTNTILCPVYHKSLTLSKRNYWNMARERSFHFLELLGAHAPSITSHYVLEGHACYPQTVKRRTPKCK